MPAIPQRIASAFAVLCGQYGDVTKMAGDREQSRQSLYREAEQVVEAVDGAAAQARIDALSDNSTSGRPRSRPPKRLRHAVEITADTQHEFATVAQARGQPQRGPAALASRDGVEARQGRGDAGAGDP